MVYSGGVGVRGFIVVVWVLGGVGGGGNGGGVGDGWWWLGSLGL